ncbi:MAG: hypothetical protein ACJ75P_12125 [Gaiellaceae bacterium]
MDFGDIPPHDTRPRWGEAGIHGIHRFREWDALVRVTGVDLEVSEVRFVALGDGTLVGDGDEDLDVASIAQAIEQELPAPYRAHAVRADDDAWTAAAEAIELVELPRELEGEELELTVRQGERTLIVDGVPAFGDTSELEQLGAERGDDFVVQASRVDGDLWDVRILPL